MSRREQREEIFKLLFRIPFYSEEEFENQLQLFHANHDEKIEEEICTYIVNKTGAVLEHIKEIDNIISSNTRGWSIDRLSKAVLAILRLGVYEVLYDEDIPERVAINEAVELSKKYADEDAFTFVNALLGKVVNE